MINTFAWIGTGRCDPNKDLVEFLVTCGIVAGWIVLILLLRKLSRSPRSTFFRYGFSFVLVISGIVGTILGWGFTWLAYACSGG